MPWFKIERAEGFAPWVMDVGNEAYGVYCRLGSYCAAKLTDGVVPEGVALRIAGADEPLRALERMGRLVRGEGVVALPHYLDLNVSRAEVEEHDLARQATKRRRRRRWLEAPGLATQTQVDARVAFYGDLCWMCRVAPWEAIDHVKPLAKGGSNWPANLRPACRACNSAKGARWPYEAAA